MPVAAGAPLRRAGLRLYLRPAAMPGTLMTSARPTRQPPSLRRLVQTPVLPRVRAREMRAERSGHRVSSAHLQAAYPFVAEGGLGSRGVYVGRDLHGGSF